jgi:hypothetical protein
MKPSEIAMHIFASMYDKKTIKGEDIHDLLTIDSYAGIIPALDPTDVDVAVELVTSLNEEYNR